MTLWADRQQQERSNPMEDDVRLLARNLGVNLDNPTVLNVLERLVSYSHRGNQVRSVYQGLVIDKGLVSSGTMLTHPGRTVEMKEMHEPERMDLGMMPVSYRTHVLQWRHLGFAVAGVELNVWTARRGMSSVALLEELLTASSERLIAGGSMRAAYELCDRIEKDLHSDRP